MKKYLLLAALAVATSVSAQNVAMKSQAKVKMPQQTMLKAAGTVGFKSDIKKAPRKSLDSGLLYAKPAGSYYEAWGRDGYGYGNTRIIVPVSTEFTFPNLSDDPTTTIWHFDYTAVGSDDRDLTEYANADGSFSGDLNPGGYYMVAPTIYDARKTQSFVIGKLTNYYWNQGGQYERYITQVVTDGPDMEYDDNDELVSFDCAPTMHALVDDHKNGYGFGSLSTGYLYGTGSIEGRGECYAVETDMPAPISPMYCEGMTVGIIADSEDILQNGAKLTATIYNLDTQEEVVKLTAGIENIDRLEYVNKVSYTQTGVYYSGSIYFSNETVDAWGNTGDEPFVIDFPYAVVIEGFNQPGVNVGIGASEAEEEDQDVLEYGGTAFFMTGQEEPLSYNGAPLVAHITFQSLFDVANVSTELYGGQDGSIVYENTNSLTIPVEGGDAISTNPQLAGMLDCVYVNTAYPWFDIDDAENYYIEAPEWITEVLIEDDWFNVDNSTIYISVVGEPLPAGVTGRECDLYIEGRGVKSAAPIHVIQGEPQTDGVNSVSANTAKKNVSYNVLGQRVNANAKGIVIKNGQKFVK